MLQSLRNLVLAVSLATMVGCGGGDSNGNSSVGNVISTAEFLLVDPPSLSELFAVLRIITGATANLRDDPNRFARELFDGVRDAIADAEPVPGVNPDELFELAVDQLTRESWRLILDDPLRGVIATEVFDDALRAALENYSCDAHDSHIGAKTEAFFQVLWLILILQLTSDEFIDEFAADQSEGLSVAAANMLRSNADFASRVFDQFPTASFNELVLLLLTAPFDFVPDGSAAQALSFISNKQPLDGRYSGTANAVLGADENVVLHVNRCNQDVRAQLLVLDGSGGVDAQWRLTGTANANGDVVLRSASELDKFFVSQQTALCGDLTLTLNSNANTLAGQWDASKNTCLIRGSVNLTEDP